MRKQNWIPDSAASQQPRNDGVIKYLGSGRFYGVFDANICRMT